MNEKVIHKFKCVVMLNDSSASSLHFFLCFRCIYYFICAPPFNRFYHYFIRTSPYRRIEQSTSFTQNTSILFCWLMMPSLPLLLSPNTQIDGSLKSFLSTGPIINVLLVLSKLNQTSARPFERSKKDLEESEQHRKIKKIYYTTFTSRRITWK